MDSSTGAVVIAAVGVLGTLAGTIVSQILSARARRADFEMQRSQKQEEYIRQRQEADLANKRSCYISVMATSRRYRVTLMNYLRMAKEEAVNSDAQSELENARRSYVDALAEVHLVATLKVLSTIDPLGGGLSKAYHAIKHLESGEPDLDGSFEEINQFLNKLWDQWRHMRDAMRQDLGIED